jgi:hypothetical protein
MHVLKAVLIALALLLMPDARDVQAEPSPTPAPTDPNGGWVRIVPKPLTINGRL